MAIEKNQRQQTKQVKKFQNLTTSYRKLIDKMSVGDRLAMLRSSQGQSMLSSLTPSQLADMFPDYYKKQYPDVGKILKSITSPTFARATAAQAEASMELDRSRLRRGERIPQPDVTPKWMKILELETGRKLSDPGAKAKLSDEQKKILDELSKGNIPADDPRVAFLKKISPEDLKKFGIDIVERDGKQEFKQIPIEVTQEEIEKARKATITGANNQEIIMKAFADELRKKGVPEQNLPYAVAALAGQVKQESGFNPNAVHDNNTGYGIYGARDPSPGRGRKTDMFKWLEENGYEKNSPEGQARYMVHEAMTKGEYAPSRNALMTANKDNVLDTSSVLTNNFERPKERQQNTIARARNANNYLGAAKNIVDAPEVLSGANDAQVEEAIRAKKQKEREVGIAERAIPQLPEGVDAKIVTEFNKMSPARKQDLLAMIEAAGRGDQSKGVATINRIFKENPSLIQEGIFNNTGKLSFSDPSVAERSSQLNGYMQGALNKFQEFAPEGTTITSTYRAPTHPIEARKMMPGAHTRGAAIDLRTEGKTKEELARTVQALKRAGFTKVLLEDDHIHAEVNPGQSFHISNLGRGNRNIDLDTAYGAANMVAFNEELPGNQKDREKPKPVEIANVEPTATPAPAPAPSTSQVQTQPQPQVQGQQPPQPQVQGQPQAQTSNTQNQTANTEIIQAQTEVPKVDVYAQGGQENINSDQIKAMPIDSLKGDNSVVLNKEDKPLFTMNTKEEQALYNPKTRQVDVQPITKTDPNSIGEKKTATGPDMTDNIEAQQQAAVVLPPAQGPAINPAGRSMDTSMTITDDLLKDPSFRRAIAKTRFHDTGDATLGGHFGMANADLG